MCQDFLQRQDVIFSSLPICRASKLFLFRSDKICMLCNTDSLLILLLTIPTWPLYLRIIVINGSLMWKNFRFYALRHHAVVSIMHCFSLCGTHLLFLYGLYNVFSSTLIQSVCQNTSIFLHQLVFPPPYTAWISYKSVLHPSNKNIYSIQAYIFAYQFEKTPLNDVQYR